jgi:hypothetical protein
MDAIFEIKKSVSQEDSLIAGRPVFPGYNKGGSWSV